MTALERRFPRPKDFAPLMKPGPWERDSTKRRLAKARDVWDLRRIARRRTPAGPFHYADGGSDGEVSLRRAREAFADLDFRPGVLRDVARSDMTTTVLGQPSALPFGFAPTGFTRMMHSAGERAVVAVAERAGIPFCLSTVGTASIGQIASIAPKARKWFQLYLWKDRELSLELVRDAKAAGYEALLVTVDVPVSGNRLRDQRNGMTIPPRLTAKTFLDASYRWRWWFDFLSTEPYSFAFDTTGRGSLGDLMRRLADPSVTFADLAWLREAWDGPVLVKGITSVEDALAALEHGADGVVVSSHGGRQLDRGPVALHVLPDIVAAVGDRGTVVLDTGIMNGGDIVAAIALGADFTLVGRAFLYGLMAGGEAGVARCVEILSAEIERTMKFLGVAALDELHPGHVRLMSRRAPIGVAGQPIP
ncbi:alpha-hydroxy acid oxidase [Actinospica sp.]|jgi:isopentenyl diphosphate isomerase/L-lactate dehydrogenase-like FMN-dependent dehydrogenase|uniref:alpha-hydroxy acid oxidase n=1 Tax=Actinospica sp. TaxID=1872142 RepID=UPI002CEFFEC8|nr:alpha-hydroxy acid oxidase [Actinospica sp.]HWG25559.1 alpha-hydroxy acid oxidase [Actinospica sp.]